MNAFSELTKESLKYYVYCLVDPRDNKIFYIGKGKNDRIFQHAQGGIEGSINSEKIDMIREIIESGKSVQYYILKHNIENEKIAYEFESFLIEFMEFQDFSHHFSLSNIQGGHHSFINGIQTVEELESIYGSKEETVDYFEQTGYKLLIININKTMEPGSLYEATRSSWKLVESRAKQVDYVLSEFRGVIRAVFKPERWLKVRNSTRLEFEGVEVKDPKILELFLNKKIEKKHGSQNPIRYVNC